MLEGHKDDFKSVRIHNFNTSRSTTLPGLLQEKGASFATLPKTKQWNQNKIYIYQVPHKKLHKEEFLWTDLYIKWSMIIYQLMEFCSSGLCNISKVPQCNYSHILN